jgi:hypothetical protein
LGTDASLFGIADLSLSYDASFLGIVALLLASLALLFGIVALLFGSLASLPGTLALLLGSLALLFGITSFGRRRARCIQFGVFLGTAGLAIYRRWGLGRQGGSFERFSMIPCVTKLRTGVSAPIWKCAMNNRRRGDRVIAARDREGPGGRTSRSMCHEYSSEEARRPDSVL